MKQVECLLEAEKKGCVASRDPKISISKFREPGLQYAQATRTSIDKHGLVQLVSDPNPVGSRQPRRTHQNDHMLYSRFHANKDLDRMIIDPGMCLSGWLS